MFQFVGLKHQDEFGCA